MMEESGFVYVTEAEYGARVEESVVEELAGCECGGEDCWADPRCPCYAFARESSDAAFPILECGQRCACHESCSNRTVQRGIQVPLTVFDAGRKGLGIKAKAPIPKGTFVAEYIGEVISESEAKERLRERREHSYLLGVSEHSWDGAVSTTFIDPTFKGNLARFLNHSCEPNLDIHLVRYSLAHPRVALFANKGHFTSLGQWVCVCYSPQCIVLDLRLFLFQHLALLCLRDFSTFVDIENGEELCYSYAGASDAGGEGEGEEKACLCGAPACRRVLPSARTHKL